jgi:hypothetical protein
MDSMAERKWFELKPRPHKLDQDQHVSGKISFSISIEKSPQPRLASTYLMNSVHASCLKVV